ncbi:MAG: ATP-binding protein [Caulobacter sp.]|nr:ATP-binding protein [Caulobacter sp.]
MKPFGRGAPLFVQVLALVIVSLVAAHAISTAVIFSLPPPPPEIYRLSEVAKALRNPGVTTVTESRPLVVRTVRKPPVEPALRPRGVRWREDVRRSLAEALQVEPARIVVGTDGPRRVMLWTGQTERSFEVRVFRSGKADGTGIHVMGPPPGAHGRHGPPPPPAGAPRFDERVLFAPFRVAVRQTDGRWLMAQPEPSFQLGTWQGRILVTLLLSVLAIAPLAWLFARRLSAPISAFATAAERLGRDPRAPPLELGGSSEVTAAAEAFNRMQERLRRYVEDRTAMVGAIAHDLRTPLTRLRFRIEAAPEEIRGKLAADIDQMDAMISATLGFVRDATRAGPREKLELSSLIESVLDEAAETGADATALPSERLVVEGDPVALRRLAANLVENALKYGHRARGRVFAEDGSAVIEIEDDGPGIAAEELERVFEPFYRGEPSRSRETGGAGLGLAVVRSVARAHGGDVILKTRPGGGLTARVTLPL